MYKNKKSNLPEGAGLVLYKKEAKVKKQFDDQNLKIRTRKIKNLEVERIGFNAGIDKGENFHLTQGIKSEREPAKQLGLNF